VREGNDRRGRAPGRPVGSNLIDLHTSGVFAKRSSAVAGVGRGQTDRATPATACKQPGDLTTGGEPAPGREAHSDPRNSTCPGKVKTRARSPTEITDMVKRDSGADTHGAVLSRHHPDPHRRRVALRRGDPRCLQPRGDQLGGRQPGDTPDRAAGPSEVLTTHRPLPECIIQLRPWLPVHLRGLAQARRRSRPARLHRGRSSCFDHVAMEPYISTYNTHRLHASLGYVASRTYATPCSTCW
jgi:hypothetical protein